MDDFVGLQVVWPPDRTRPHKHDHDIVFVHGLQKGSVSDWKDEDGNFWPVDRLALDLSTARIFAYGYDQRKLSIRSDGLYEGGIIFEHGEHLVSELKKARSADKVETPLTFIGHGAGGILIQSALCSALLPMYQHHSILRKTRHVVFLDTPRQSLTQTAWELVAEGSPYKDSATRQMLWSTVVANVRDDFGKLADRCNITSAYGKVNHFSSGNLHENISLYNSGVPHEKVVVLEKLEKRTIPELVARGDHYEQLLSRIRAGRLFITNAEHHVQQLLSWLDPPSEALNDMTHQRNLRRYHPNTGRWLFEDPTFRDWARPGGDVSLIWLTGSEGCGKSILASQAIERIGSTDFPCATPRLMLSLDKPQSEYEFTASLASQLVSYVLANAGGVDVESLFIIEQRYNKLSRIQSLIRLLISQCAAVFFFVDGIDDIPADQEEDEDAKMTEETLSKNGTNSEKRQKMEKQNKVGRAQRHVYSTLAFLAGLASNSASAGSPVRLWCSSARTPFVQEWGKEFGAVELHADLALVGKDIEDYLDHQMDKVKPSLSMPEKSNFIDRIEKNFLLARWALEYNTKAGSSIIECESSDVATAASKGLRAFHMARLAEIQRQQSVDGKTLASDTLSIIACAKRPLKFSELQEALVVLSRPFEDIQDIGFGTLDITIDKIHQGFHKVEDIIDCCFPFLEIAQHEDAPSRDGWIRFSHASTLRLLNTSHGTAKLGIDQISMATACLKYLAQWRYSSGQLGLDSLQDNQHSFLPYAAKHWHRHLNNVGKSLLRETKSFILSSQFVSAIRIQSLLVDQHFPKSEELDEDGSLPRHSVRLPLCLDADPEGLRLVKNYQVFIQDWRDFLRLGTTTAPMRGQIQRCFWGSLPTANFLCRLGMPIESQQSYLLEAESAVPEICYLYQTHSSDGRRLAVWRLDEASTDTDVINLVRTSWHIDGERPPFRYGSDETLTTSRKQVIWDMYHDGIPRKTLLVPALNNSVRGPVMQEIVFGLEVRIGNQRFTRQKGGIWTAVLKKDWEEAYWEDIVSRGDYVVRSRRKVVAPRTYGFSTSLAKPRVATLEDDLSADDDVRNEQPITPAESDSGKETTNSRTSSQKGSKWTDGPGSDEEMESSENEPDEHLANENFEDMVSSAEEHCAESNSDDKASDDGSSSESKSDSDMDVETESDNRENGSHSDGDSDTEETAEDASASEGDVSSTADDASTFTLYDDLDHTLGVSDADDEVSSVDSQSTTESRLYVKLRSVAFSSCKQNICDICGLKLMKKARRSQATTDFYRCFPCADCVSWDICEVCFGKGKWCRNRSHPLHMGTYWFRSKKVFYRRIVSSSDATPLTNIVVERHLSGQESARMHVSRFTRRLSSMLHDSSPVIHPNIPLLVFPLDGRELLFMNMEDSTYFTYDIPYDLAETAETGAGTCLPLSVGLHLSSCGRYLQVLRFTARNESVLFTPTKLFVALFTVGLNLKNPCSGRPKISAPVRGAELGNWTALVNQMPFQSVWTDTDAYIAVIGGAPTPICRVVRFPIRTGAQYDDSEGDVYTLSEDVALPSSALFRPVYFFPATNEGAARLLLGCFRDTLSQPPVVVYLGRGNTSQWLSTKSLFMSSKTMYEHLRIPSEATHHRHDALIERPNLYDESNAITSHDSRKKINSDDGSGVFFYLMPVGLQEWIRTAFQTRGMYCPSCFQLGISLRDLAYPNQIEYLEFGIDNPTQGQVAEEVQKKWRWEMTIPTLIQALENDCQFCSFVAASIFGGFRPKMHGPFLGDYGPRCCAKGPRPKKKSIQVRHAIKLLRALQSQCDPRMHNEAGLISFMCRAMKRNWQAKSFSKMIIEANVNYQETDPPNGNPAPIAVEFYKMDSGKHKDGDPTTMTRFIHSWGLDRGEAKIAMELHSLRDDGAHEWIPTRPITTDRGGDENIAVIKEWLEECWTKHPLCWSKDNAHKPADETRLPTRLLEITDDEIVRLVEPRPSQFGQYIILSYCWGPDPSANSQTTRVNVHTRLTSGIRRKDLPASIRDAVVITSKLSFKYIWVDALCIIQDDPDDVGRELVRMSEYYRNAHLTLTASTSACNKGFLGTVGRCDMHTEFSVPRDLVPLHVFCGLDRSRRNQLGTVYVREENPYQLATEPISQRAWTLQEQLLSPRMVFFGGRVIWFCNTATRCDGGVEDWSIDENASHRLSRDFQIELIRGERMNSWRMHSVPKSPSMHLEARKNGKDDTNPSLQNLWHRIVGDYSRRKLSRPEDKLPAISAVAAEFAHLCGSEYLAGLWRSNLARDLLWSTSEADPIRPKTWRAPSWSWASVDDIILFDGLPPSNAVQLAIIEKAQVEPLTPEIPFGRLRDASGILEITAPLLAINSEGNEDWHRMVSHFLRKEHSAVVQHISDERSMLLKLLQGLAGGDSRAFVKDFSTEKDESMTFEEWHMKAKKETLNRFTIPEKVVMLVLFGKRDYSIDSDEEDRETVVEKGAEVWSFWGLVLEPVWAPGERTALQRTRAFSKMPIGGQDIAGFLKDSLGTVRII